jgi:hypothetical protein
MARRLAAFIGCLLLALGILTGVTPAGAQTCYPPPCGTAVPASHVDLNAGVISPNGEKVTSPAPFVAAGLLMVMGTLTTLCLRRRAAMSDAGQVAPADVAVAPARRIRQPEGSLR